MCLVRLFVRPFIDRTLMSAVAVAVWLILFPTVAEKADDEVSAFTRDAHIQLSAFGERGYCPAQPRSPDSRSVTDNTCAPSRHP
jgi:hypothetical protein